VDKTVSRITIVQVIKTIPKKQRKSIIYWFNEEQLFKVTTNNSTRSRLGIPRSRAEGFYFFQDQVLFYKEGSDTSQDIPLLIANANKYLAKGKEMLEGSR
jgi:hypothetical protein